MNEDLQAGMVELLGDATEQAKQNEDRRRATYRDRRSAQGRAVAKRKAKAADEIPPGVELPGESVAALASGFGAELPADRKSSTAQGPGTPAPSVWLAKVEVDALIRAATPGLPWLACMIMWRLGIRAVELVGDRRQGEAAGDALAWGDVDLVTNYATIRRGKGGKARRVPIHPELSTALYNARQVNPALAKDPGRPIIFDDRTDKVPSYRTVLRWVKAAFDKATADGTIQNKNGKIGTHLLRHSAARHWEGQNRKVSTISDWLGHASILITQDYLKTLASDQGDEMAEIE